LSSDFQKIDFIPYGHPVFGASWEEGYPIPNGARVAVIVLEPAIAGYKKALELDPKNENARQALRELKR
jgi:hypothetical protein